MANSTNLSPIRLASDVKRALNRKHGAAIKEHGLSFAVNTALAEAFGLPAPLTPTEKMSKASRARWRAQKRASKAPAKRSPKTKTKGE